MSIDVLTIVEKYLSDNGYDGLFNEQGECACLVGELSPASCIIDDCKAGYKHECSDECRADHGGWHVSAEKPACDD